MSRHLHPLTALLILTAATVFGQQRPERTIDEIKTEAIHRAERQISAHRA